MMVINHLYISCLFFWDASFCAVGCRRYVDHQRVFCSLRWNSAAAVSHGHICEGIWCLVCDILGIFCVLHIIIEQNLLIPWEIHIWTHM